MSSGIKDTSFVFLSKIATIVLSIGLQSCLAWHLGPDARGSYAASLLFATILTLVFTVGCDLAGTYFVSSKKLNLSEGVMYSLIAGTISSFLAILAGFAITMTDLSFLDKADISSFRISLIFIPASLFSLIFTRLFTAIHDFGMFSLMSVIISAFNLLFTAIFVWYFDWGVNGALWALIISAYLTFAASIFVFVFKHRIKLTRPEFTKIVSIFHYGLRYYFAKLSNQMNFQMGTIIFVLFATKEEIGWFAVASQLISRIMIIPDTVVTVLIPRVAQDNRGKAELVAMCSRLTGISCGILLGVFALLAKPIVVILLSPDFAPCVSLIQIICIGAIVRCSSKVFDSYLLGADHPEYISISVFVSALVNLGLLWFLLPRFGLIAGALAMAVSYIVSSVLLLIFFCKVSKMTILNICWPRTSDLVFAKKIINTVLTAGISRLKNTVR